MAALGTHRKGARPVPEVIATLRAERIRLRWSQLRLSMESGVCQGTVAHMERGAETPRTYNLVAIANTLKREITTVPLCPVQREREAVEWLRARGWTVRRDGQ